MSFDDDLRRTLRTEAGRYDPADDGWDDISAGVRTARNRRRRVQGGVLGVVAVAVVAAGIGLTMTDDATDVDAGPFSTEPTTATSEPTETTAPPTTEGAAPADDGVFPGIWPFASQEAIDRYADGDARFEDPVATADAFARDYLGMLDPVVGEAEPADGDAVQVELRPKGESGEPVPDGGPSTVVTLRSYETSAGSDVWTVTAASSPNIVVTSPQPLDEVASPLAVRGEATGYEGTVIAQVRQDGMRAGESLGEAFGIAAQGALAPFELEVSFPPPAEPTGALVVHTDTGLDGVGVPEATVVRIAFDASLVGRATCSPPPLEGEASADEMDVTVYFICEAAADADPEEEATYVPVLRRQVRDPAVLGAALRSFLAGSTVEEEEVHGVSAFTYHAATDVDVTLDGTTAIVDFAPSLTGEASGASTSTGSQLFRGALNRTVFQFPTVERIEYRLGGSCEAFWEWQQVGGCPLVTRDDL